MGSGAMDPLDPPSAGCGEGGSLSPLRLREGELLDGVRRRILLGQRVEGYGGGRRKEKVADGVSPSPARGDGGDEAVGQRGCRGKEESCGKYKTRRAVEIRRGEDEKRQVGEGM